MQHFRLATVTYGTECAPYQALRVLLEILKIFLANASINDLLVKALIVLYKELSFVDDFFGGADDLEFAAQIICKLISILQNHGIELRKWASNDKRLLATLPSASQADKLVNLYDLTNTLRLKWSPVLDYFSFQVTSFKKIDTPKYFQ